MKNILGEFQKWQMAFNSGDAASLEKKGHESKIGKEAAAKFGSK